MLKISDKELLNELSIRFEENYKALHDVKKMTQKLADVNIKLITSEKMKSNFLSNIRNEINNPLSSILGISEILLDEEMPNEEKMELIKTINRESFFLTFQMSNIFVAAELEAGELVLNSSLINIRHIVISTLNNFMKHFSSKNINFTLIANEENHSIYESCTDPEKFEIVMSNLISNAAEYSLNNSEIVISIQRVENSFVIGVEDIGEVIEESNYKKIFDRFFQIDSGIVKHHLGHGLGLSITKELIEIMGGSITVESNKETKVTKFTVTLPINDIENGAVFSEESNEFMFDTDLEFEDDGAVF